MSNKKTYELESGDKIEFTFLNENTMKVVLKCSNKRAKLSMTMSQFEKLVSNLYDLTKLSNWDDDLFSNIASNLSSEFKSEIALMNYTVGETVNIETYDAKSVFPRLILGIPLVDNMVVTISEIRRIYRDLLGTCSLQHTRLATTY